MYIHEKFDEECDSDFKKLLEGLDDGCYKGNFGNHKVGHAVLLIKVDGEYFLFDPTYATLKFDLDELATHLWKEAFKISDKEKPHAFNFEPCQVKED